MIQACFRIVAPERNREEIVGVLLCLKGPTEVARGCRGCQIVQDVDDENVLTYLVTWESQGDLEEHLRCERFRRLLPYLEMSREPPEINFSTISQIRGVDFLVEVLSSGISP